MKQRSQWPTFILGANFGSYWLIIPRHHVHSANTYHDIRQNHWPMKSRLSLSSFNDPQVNVTRLRDIWSTICFSCFHNCVSEKNHFKGSIFWHLVPPRGMDSRDSCPEMKVNPSGYLWSKYECFLTSGCQDMKSRTRGPWANTLTRAQAISSLHYFSFPH